MVFAILTLAFSLSLDALVAGLVYGMRKVKIPLFSKLIICFFSIAYSAFALFLGNTFSSFLNPLVSKSLGIAILVCMGMWIIFQAVFKRKPEGELPVSEKEKTLLKIAVKSLGITIQIVKNPMDVDLDRSGTIDASESFLLGLALSLDAIGVGIGSSLAGFSSALIPFYIGLFQMSFLYIGSYLGEKFHSAAKFDERIISMLPGILLLFIALARI